MKIWCRCLVIATLSAAAMPAVHGPVAAQSSTTLRQELLASLNDAGGKLVELAQAMPQRKYTWRPNKDVRSVSEVYLHVVASNELIPVSLGVKPDAGWDFNNVEKSTTDKAKIIAMLKTSIEHARTVINGTSDAELDQTITLFGKPATKRAGLLHLVEHNHEHLGQSIAYARMNGVVPPWTAREQAAAAAKARAKAEENESGR